MIRQLYVAAAVWAGVGLSAGLYYRSLTQATGFTRGMETQLAPTHTHALVLGCLWMLVVMALVRVFDLEELPQLPRFFWTWQIGLTITLGAMFVKGTLQVLQSPAAGHKALAGVAGIGHVIMTIAVVLLFVVLNKGLRALSTKDTQTADERTK
ncbi:Protein of unknown function [Austwickia chelonae]|uniref:DUF2871 domain-containing protein n=1 Tax=Austwickia chelonae NBRC 105200 TaxID=1184607 RepID=K6UN52_9MICO|nr:DUF2871 domain-containing protein [Austwickia chelonae]GAB78691.1 hypothetical protein AUCHE_16_01110 [Austwickia chelonae NBRC 105200]SEW34756.1 Protein of unknown function [Austwickia chelonae]